MKKLDAYDSTAITTFNSVMEAAAKGEINLDRLMAVSDLVEYAAESGLLTEEQVKAYNVLVDNYLEVEDLIVDLRRACRYLSLCEGIRNTYEELSNRYDHPSFKWYQTAMHDALQEAEEAMTAAEIEW